MIILCKTMIILWFYDILWLFCVIKISFTLQWKKNYIFIFKKKKRVLYIYIYYKFLLWNFLIYFWEFPIFYRKIPCWEKPVPFFIIYLKLTLCSQWCNRIFSFCKKFGILRDKMKVIIHNSCFCVVIFWLKINLNFIYQLINFKLLFKL